MDPRIRQQARSDANRKRGCPARVGQPLFRFLPPPFGTSAEPASPFPQRLPGILFRFIGASRNNGTSSFSVEDAGCKITGPKRDTAPSCDRAGTPFRFRPRTVRPGGKRRLHRNPAIRTVSTGRAQSRTSVRPPPTGKREKNGYDMPTSPEDCRGEKRMKEIRASCLLRNDPYSGNTARSAGSDVSDRPHAAAAISPERTESTVRVFRYLCGRQRG